MRDGLANQSAEMPPQFIYAAVEFVLRLGGMGLQARHCSEKDGPEDPSYDTVQQLKQFTVLKKSLESNMVSTNP